MIRCLAQEQSADSEARTCDPYISSFTLYHKNHHAPSGGGGGYIGRLGPFFGVTNFECQCFGGLQKK